MSSLRKPFLLAAAAGLSLQGCALATIPLNVAAAGAISGQHSRAASNVTNMNCSQLRARWAELEKNKIGMFNPLGTWSLERNTIYSSMKARGCRLPAGA